MRARDNTDRICPIRENTGGFDSYTARGRNWIARQILEGKINAEDFSEEFVDHLYSCLLCGNCTEHCLLLDPETWDRFPRNKLDDHKIDNNKITEALRGLVVEEGMVPSEIRDVLRNVYRYGNPMGEPRRERDAFTEELNFNIKNEAEEECETLFYVGSTASYNKRNQKTAQAVAEILHAANFDFGILGTEEEDSGADIRRLGEEGLFEELAKRNLELFRKYRINHIVCLSPHDYDAFHNDYPRLLGEEWLKLDLTVQHYSECIINLICEGKLEVRNKLDKTVTFHDPCNLGRRNGIYGAPRKIIQKTGAKLIEMELSKANSYCCGGGGGGLWYEPRDKPKVENQRARQALESGADILAVACPKCAQMLENGMNAIEGDMEILDVSEIVLEAIDSE